jgi:ABC-type multidrug transport system ATPase subunit
MQEVEALADRVIIINAGSIIVDDTPSVLKRSLPHREKVLIKSNAASRYTEYGTVEAQHDRLIVYPYDRSHRERLIHRCIEDGAETNVVSTSLEDVYVAAVTGRSATQPQKCRAVAR